MPTELNEYGLKPGEINPIHLLNADKFIGDIYKNLKQWVPKGQSIFYLTDNNWYQFRLEGGFVRCVRCNIKTHVKTNGLAFKNRLPIGKSWLSEPKQKEKRVKEFFKFIADIQRR